MDTDRDDGGMGVDEMVTTWTCALEQAARRAVGKKKVGRESKPWFSRDIDNMRIEAAIAKHLACAEEHDPHSTELSRHYRRTQAMLSRRAYRRELRRKKKQQRDRTFRDMEHSQGNCKLFWRKVKALLSNTRHSDW